MKIVKDTQKMEDANDFGEALREYCFLPSNGGIYGCYSTFKLRPEFKKFNPTEDILSILLGHNYRGNEYYSGNEVVKIEQNSCFSNGNVIVAWYWDGDGTLYFREGKKAAFNNDCKKDYCWEWVKP